MRKRPWSADEDRTLQEAVAEFGSRWEKVAERTGRSADACRVYYNTQARAGRWPHGANQQAAPPEVVAEAERLWELGLTAPGIATRLKLPLTTIENWVQAGQIAGRMHRREPARTVSIKPRWAPPSDDAPEAVWSRAEQRTAKDLTKHQHQHHADVVLPGEVVAIAVVSDQHIRLSGPVDLQRMREDAELIRDTPGLYAILGGDGCDNHIKHHAAMIHGGTEPSEEWRLFDHYLSMFGDKILAIASGNHDDWTSDMAGVSKLRDLAEQRRLFMAPDEVTLHCRVGAQTYVGVVRHQYRFNSQLNQVHTVKQLWSYGNTKFDFGVVCHHHTPAIEPFLRHGQVVWGARPGSYQYTSAYARRYGHATAFPTCPTFVMYPDRHEIFGCLDVRQAVRFLAAERGGVAA